MNIGILGGSFNPVHYGHLAISDFAIKKLKLKKLIWMVNPCNPFKKIKDQAPLKDRVDGCKNILNGICSSYLDGNKFNSISVNKNKINVIDIEKTFPTTQTYYSISRLKNIYKEYNIIWLAGLDNAAHMHTWKGIDTVIKNHKIVFFSRIGQGLDLKGKNFKQQIALSKVLSRYDYSMNGFKGSERITIFTNKMIDISSSQIRKNHV